MSESPHRLDLPVQKALHGRLPRATDAATGNHDDLWFISSADGLVWTADQECMARG